jgi:antitoxin component HigA of HigAB toxin-antitoxin module
MQKGRSTTGIGSQSDCDGPVWWMCARRIRTRMRSGSSQSAVIRPCDLLEVFGSRGIASEVANGKRAISKAQAKKLAELFHVPADLFL